MNENRIIMNRVISNLSYGERIALSHLIINQNQYHMIKKEKFLKK